MSTVTVSQRARLSGWRPYVHDLWSRREFAWFLAMGNLKARNASTGLGLFWWVLNPVLMSAVYFVAFGIIFKGRRADPEFLAWLLSGMFAFNYTATAMTSGANSIIGNRNLLVNIRFPRLIFPITGLIETGIGFLASLGVYYVIVWPTNGVRPSSSLVWLPVAIVLHTAFNMGIAAFVARLAVPIRDVNNLIPHLNRMWLYLSPIIWPITLLDDLPSLAQRVIEANPMFVILSVYRAALMGRQLEASDVWLTAFWAAIALVAGVLSFVRYEGNMVRHL